VTNPRLPEITLERVIISAGINSTVYIFAVHTFNTPIVIPGFGKIDSGMIYDVSLTHGLLKDEDIDLGYLDIYNLDVYFKYATINGEFGIPRNVTGLEEKRVPTT
ncbi:hypothetical protein ARMGADRAFT_917493, partial [Armillaria gallica]